MAIWPKPDFRILFDSGQQQATNWTESVAVFLVYIFVLVVIGTGLIGLIWGFRSALLGGICLLGGAMLIVGLWLLLSLIQKWVDE